ncbi:hypothetical protein [Streptacidiphilus neutrinimicus]|uniref:hypothetical protein n=1 Tax=Streptacidiphilus neutrinimicus TaxID=105420 RepID=UPI0006942BDC|nr:hypothetical protein [Streptacidiphilus neutrinimicus]
MSGSVFSAGAGGARIIVHRPAVDAAGQPFRRVDLFDLEVGRAYSPDDVKAIMAQCGVDPAEFDRPGVVDWRGGGPEAWG